MCFFHNWGEWTRYKICSGKIKNLRGCSLKIAEYVELRKKRSCSKCGKVEEKHIDILFNELV